MRIVAITENNTVIAVNDSGRVNEFCAFDQAYVDERNSVETVMDSYGYLFDELDEDEQARYENAEEYFQQMIDSEINYGDGLFIGHDTSYCHKIDMDLIQQHLGEDIIGLECVGSGGDIWFKEKFKVILDKDFVKASQKRSREAQKKRDAEKKREKLLEKQGASVHWSGLALIQGEAV